MKLTDIKFDTTNNDKVAIVVVGYNRLKSLQRLLQSLLQAKYPSNDIPLIISIDASGEEELYSYVQSFKWNHGPLYINIEEKRLGLRNHIYKCGDLCELFRAIILLEDDLVVSPYFYTYTLKILNVYGDDSRIAQISLYKNEMNGYVGLPFVNLQNGADVFLMQDVSTWGECWNKRMWIEFKNWRDTHTDADILDIDMPSAIKRWTRAWSKYYNAYVVDTNKFVLYPNVSVVTNFSDAGEHGGDNNSLVQVNLLQADFEYRLPEYDSLVKYDIYFNNVDLYKWICKDNKDLCLDIYGFGRLTEHHKFMLSTEHLPYMVVQSYALNMRPIELNIKMNISGSGIYLYDITKQKKIIKGTNNDLTSYYLRDFNVKRLLSFVCRHYMKALINKLVQCIKF